MQTLAAQIAALPPGKHKMTVNDLRLVIYYDEKPARGDAGGLVPGTVTGEYEVFEQTTDDDTLGLKEIHRQHMSPYGGRYGNASAKSYATERCAEAIMRRLARRR